MVIAEEIDQTLLFQTLKKSVEIECTNQKWTLNQTNELLGKIESMAVTAFGEYLKKRQAAFGGKITLEGKVESLAIGRNKVQAYFPTSLFSNHECRTQIVKEVHFTGTMRIQEKRSKRKRKRSKS